MADPKLPKDIAKRIAALAKSNPASLVKRSPKADADDTGPAPPRTPSAPKAPGNFLRTFLAAGWVLALLLGAAAWGEYQWFTVHGGEELARQKADYEALLARQAADADAKLKAAVAEREAAHATQMQAAQASQQAIQTELDYQKQPDLPLKITMQPPALTGSRVLSVSNETNTEITVTVNLRRPNTGATKAVDFTVKPRGFRDVGALEGWEFEKGDQIEFIKPGFKPRRFDVP